MTILATLGRQALRIAAVRRAALTAGAARGYGLALVFHQISGDANPRQGLVPSVHQDLFRRQIEVLLDIGRVVQLEDLLKPHYDWHRPRFALTFDDDSATHYEQALPVLRDLGVTATFFLSGRALHGLGPLWFERLDGLISARGVHATAHSLGISTTDLEGLARTCENDRQLQERIQELPDVGVRHVRRNEIRALAEAGMAIGFHTLNHPLLSLLPDSVLDEELTRGRSELENAAGEPVRLFAYPHGKADQRVAKRLPAAGFVAAWTGRPLAFRPGDDPYCLGRWEPGPITLDRLVAGIAAKVSGLRRSG